MSYILRQPLLGSGLHRRPCPLLWVPELSPASVISFSQQQLTTEPQQFFNSLTQQATYKVMLRPTVGQSAGLCVQHLSGAQDQSFIILRQLHVFMWGALSDERTGLSFIITARPRQHSHSRDRIPRDS
jgi:hypothetical protein